MKALLFCFVCVCMHVCTCTWVFIEIIISVYVCDKPLNNSCLLAGSQSGHCVIAKTYLRRQRYNAVLLTVLNY